MKLKIRRFLNKILIFLLKRRIRIHYRIILFLTRTGRVIAKSKHGINFSLDVNDDIDNIILHKGYFEGFVLEAIERYISENDTFWDIGANVGVHSLTIKKKYPSINCMCFEPYYKNFEKLLSNEKINPTLKLDKFNIALHNNISISKIYTTPFNSGRTGLIPLSNTTNENFYIPTLQGDSLVEKMKLKPPNIIKIDVEGNELNVLIGCENILNNPKLHTIIFETHHLLDEITSLLQKYGFAIQKIGEYPDYIAHRNNVK